MLTPDLIKAHIKKHYELKLHKVPSFYPDDPNAVFVPLELLPQIYYELLAKEKKPKKKAGAPLYFKEFIDAYNQFYTGLAWNTRQIKPLINTNASEKSALWNIMKQIQELADSHEPKIDYTPEIAIQLFRAALKSAQHNKFLKDKISLHLINKNFNDLIADAMRRTNIYVENKDYNNFDHITKKT